MDYLILFLIDSTFSILIWIQAKLKSSEAGRFAFISDSLEIRFEMIKDCSMVTKTFIYQINSQTILCKIDYLGLSYIGYNIWFSVLMWRKDVMNKQNTI